MRPNTDHNPDVLTCLANLSSDEVFTPPSVANQMLDLLPKKLWKDEKATFLDPVSKSGVFLREIAKRLIKGLEPKIPDLEARLEHIFTKQVFGIAITELTALLSRRSVYCSKLADGKYSVSSGFDDEDGNILFSQIRHSWEKGKCIYCGASKKNFDRGTSLETHAYEFIHTENPEEIFDMKFDVIIGNPPYQLNDGGFGASASPIYNKFVEQAKKLNPRFLCMIIPSRWFAGGKGLDDFRENMLNDKKIKKIVDFPDAKECFPGVDIAGGVCYFLWKKNHSGMTEIENIWRGNSQISKRHLDEFNTFVRFGSAASIIKKIKKFNEPSMDSLVSSRKPFGLSTDTRSQSEGELTLIWNGGEGKFQKDLISKGKNLIPKWKVMTSKVSYDHGGQPNRDGMRRVLSKVFLAPPNTICTETYIVAGSFNNKKEAENLENYLKLKLTRFLIAQMSFSQDITKDRFSFVPILDWKKSYSDKELYKKYKFDEEEINFIENTTMVMK